MQISRTYIWDTNISILYIQSDNRMTMTMRTKHSAKKRNNEFSLSNAKFSFKIRSYVWTGILTAVAVFDRIPYLQFLHMESNIFLSKSM